MVMLDLIYGRIYIFIILKHFTYIFIILNYSYIVYFGGVILYIP